MGSFFRRLNISKKLFVSSLVFALPLGVLAYFMDLSFVYDINIALKEKRGNRYLREVASLYIPVSEYFLWSSAESKSEAAHSIDDLLLDISNNAPRTTRSLLYTPDITHAEKDLFLNLEKLKNLWKSTKGKKRDPESYSAMISHITLLFSNIGDASMILLDPALDSHYLGETLIKGLPVFFQETASLAFFVKTMKRDNLTGKANPASSIYLEEKTAFFKNRVEELILRPSQIVLEEDANYYGISPTLHDRYTKALVTFIRAQKELFAVLQMVGRNNPSPELEKEKNEAIKASILAGYNLFDIGNRELGILLEKRMRSYHRWRWIAIASSLFALGIASWLVYSISRGIVNPILSIIGYTQKVSNGDYNAKLPLSFSGEFAKLSADIQKMVSELKMRLAFSQGILESIAAPFMVLDIDEKITFVNIAMLRLLHYPIEPESHHGRNIDDFGTGYSSLSYLPMFPFDYLKVDRSFVVDLETKNENLHIVETIIALAHDLGKKVIAEGIETGSHLEMLRKLGCDFGQGFFFSRPLPSNETEKLIAGDPVW